MSTLLTGTELVGGVGEGELLWADIGLSFWGGVNPLDSTVIDHTHPLYKQKMAGKVCIKIILPRKVVYAGSARF